MSEISHFRAYKDLRYCRIIFLLFCIALAFWYPRIIRFNRIRWWIFQRFPSYKVCCLFRYEFGGSSFKWVIILVWWDLFNPINPGYSRALKPWPGNFICVC